jgi:hypothetical protein
MQITSYRVRGDDKVVLGGDDGKTYHVLHAENAMAWMSVNTTNIPTLASISPVTSVALPATPDFTLTLTGTNFAATDEVLINNAPVTKTFVSATSMTTLIKPSLVTPPAKWDVSVRKGVFQTASKSLNFT